MTFHEKIRKEININWFDANTLDEFQWVSNCLIYVVEGTIHIPLKWYWAREQHPDEKDFEPEMGIGYFDRFSEKFYSIKDFKKAVKKETILKNFK